MLLMLGLLQQCPAAAVQLLRIIFALRGFSVNFNWLLFQLSHTMFKPALLLLVLAIAPFAVLAIDPPACPDGQGLIDTSKPTYTRNPDPKNCKDCAVSGCIYW
jgi:hypothetical protein